MTAGRIVELVLDGCLEIDDLLRGRTRLMAAVFVLAVIALSPETFINVVTARARPMLDAATDVVLESVETNRFTPDLDTTGVDLDAP
jgi:hypothetical protein